jgi:hypothetical protein
VTRLLKYVNNEFVDGKDRYKTHQSPDHIFTDAGTGHARTSQPIPGTPFQKEADNPVPHTPIFEVRPDRAF